MKQVDIFIDNIHKIPVENGYQFDHILIPGEIEWLHKEKRSIEGIKVDIKTWNEILELTKELEIDIRSILENRN
jgi:LDH2 family malate/lactate/ureidoglycolate dehydrogenase